ncbi:helix-turn-helix domain-containing protein [Embleya sp. NPDC050154]|uniref:helix-turn-helix domain-containing protein n=1 Tax=unclassified Embleya TaxID=2699296 RepID=UPI002F911E58|nr:helix-turn-helix domain-containing protein [Embleya sp. NBC_00888]
MIDAKDVPSPEHPEDAFAAVVALRGLAASLERAAVDHALAQGWTWNHIGQALGMSAQAAHKRLSPSRRTPPQDR